jgi:probable rRNA maturation factor
VVEPDRKSRQARLRVTVTDGAGRAIRDGGLSAWLTSVAPARASGEVAIALVSDARIRTLNRRFRRADKTTDVLSFPTDSVNFYQSSRGPTPARRRSAVALRATSLRRLARAAGAPVFFGDIVIATGVARRQAKQAAHSYQSELRVLALHGLLHLLGYDHHARDDRGRMARIEARLRRRGGLRAGLIERAHRQGSGRTHA